MYKRLERIAGLLWASGPLACITLLAFSILGGILPSLQLWVGKLIIDTVVTTPGLVSYALELVAVEFGLLVALAMVQTSNTIVQEVFGEKLTFSINERILQKANSLDLTYFEDPTFYDQLQRAQREAGYRPLGLLFQTLGLIQGTIACVALGILLSRLGFYVVPVLLLTSIPVLITTVRFAQSGYLLARARTPEARQMSYIRNLLGTDQAAKEIKLFALGPHLIKQFQTLFTTVHRETRQLAFQKGGARVLSSMVASGGYAALYGYLVWFGRLTVGDLTLYAAGVLQLNQQIQGLLENGAKIYQNFLFIDDLFTYLDLPPRLVPPGDPVPIPAVITQGIVFEEVSFRYPGSQRDVLERVSFTLAPGQTVALVGENGSGKTTLVKLLCRLYEPTAGRILLEGRDLKAYDPDELRRLIGVIFQDFVRYHATARDNIGYGRIEQLENWPEIEQAAAQGGATELIAGLPAGYETMLGKWFRQGQDLSGGQWQKIALSRAYLRQAPVLVLDEPTAALDARAEHEVFSKFRDLRQGRIALLISHRFSTVITADRILVLEGGTILESGTHEQLLALEGRYHELFMLQAQGYRVPTAHRLDGSTIS